VRNGFHASVDTTTEDSSDSFLIKHEKLDLRILLAPQESLLLHEETIPDRVAELKHSLLLDGIVKDPIVIDANSYVVLDGMHRLAALRGLRCLRIPVCAVDYLNSSIRVGTWFRVFSGEVIPSQFEAIISSSDIRMERFSMDITSFTENSSLAMLFRDGEYFRLMTSGLRLHEVVEATEQCARKLRLGIAFETEHDAIEKLLNMKADAIMSLPKIDKESIRQAGLTRHLLPHKVTRHIIPARPLSVNVPLKTLSDETLNLRDVNQQFVKTLRTRGTTRRPPGIVVEGRRYEEETFIFN